MKNRIVAIFIYCFFVSTITGYGQKLQDSLYTASQLKADLDVFQEALTNLHPALYAYQTPNQLADKFAKVDAALKDGMTDLDFLGLVSTITKSIGCGHTATYQVDSKAEKKRLKKLPKEERDTFNYLPFNGSFIAGRLFVGESFDSLLVPTTEILSIDNHSIRELEQIVYNFPSISEDGQGKRLRDFFAREGALKGVYSTYFPVKDSVTLLLQGPTGKNSRTFKTKKIHEFKREPVLLDSTQWNLKFRKGKVKKKYRRMHSSIYFYQHIDRPEVALLNLKSFKSGFKPTFNLVFDYLKSQNTNHLIIDLRGNLGGDIESVISLGIRIK